jgi:hypothetical protein
MLLKENEFKDPVFLDCLVIQKQEMSTLIMSINFSNYFSRNGVASQEDSNFNKNTVIISNLAGKRPLLTGQKYSSGSKYPSTRIHITVRNFSSLKIVI